MEILRKRRLCKSLKLAKVARRCQCRNVERRSAEYCRMEGKAVETKPQSTRRSSFFATTRPRLDRNPLPDASPRAAPQLTACDRVVPCDLRLEVGLAGYDAK